MQTTIILADDHPLLLEGTRSFLEHSNYKVLAVASDGNEAYNTILKNQPDIAILDFDMPKLNGIEVAELCKQKNIAVKIIILTLYKQEAIVKEIGQCIHGYIIKEDALSELKTCIAKIIEGQTYTSKNINEQIFFKATDINIDSLTATELKILKYLAKDLSSAAIADHLFISKRTVEKHRSNIIKKLNIPPTQNGLILWVQKHQNLFDT